MRKRLSVALMGVAVLLCLTAAKCETSEPSEPKCVTVKKNNDTKPTPCPSVWGK